MNMFEVRFEISEDEWAKARRRRDDGKGDPTFDSFYGDVVIEIDGDSLLGEPFNISVADLACGFARILQGGFPTRESAALFRQGDDSLEIHFSAEGDEVVVASEGRTGRVPKHTFIAGARSFVRRFTALALERVPRVLNWQDLTVLAAFAGPEKYRIPNDR